MLINLLLNICISSEKAKTITAIKINIKDGIKISTLTIISIINKLYYAKDARKPYSKFIKATIWIHKLHTLTSPILKMSWNSFLHA